MTAFGTLDLETPPEEFAIQRIASLLDAGNPPRTPVGDALIPDGSPDVDVLREFVYRLLVGEFGLPDRPGRGGLRQLFRSFGYPDHEIRAWLKFSRSETGESRSERLDYYAGWITAILARPEPMDLSDLHAARARTSTAGRLEQVRDKAAERCIKEHWLGYLPRAIRNGDFRSTGTNFVFRAAVGGKLYAEGSLNPKHLSLFTRTILFPILETPRGFPLYWQTADDPQYRNVSEDRDQLFQQLPVERKKGTDARRDKEPLDDMLYRLLNASGSMIQMLQATSSRLFLVCRTCGAFVKPGAASKNSLCISGRCTWDPIVVKDHELVGYELAEHRVRVKVCRRQAHIWSAHGASRCPVVGCDSPPMPYRKKVSVEIPVSYSRNVDYETFLRDFDI